MASAADTALETLKRVERPARLAITVVLVFVMAQLTARLIWSVAAPSPSVATFTDRPLPSPMRSASSTIAISTDRTILLRANPFDHGEVDLVVQDVPETNLNMHLDGLRMSVEARDSGNAIIRTPDGRASNFSVGDEILPGVTLERILSDRVIINRDGADETLMLGGRGAGLSVISDDSQTLLPEADETGLSSASAPVSDLIEGRLAGPEVFFGAINAGPVMVNGALSGYRLSPIGNSQIMRQAGLQPGDVLLQINGESVANFDIDDVIGRVSATETAELRIERNGIPVLVRLSFGE